MNSTYSTSDDAMDILVWLTFDLEKLLSRMRKLKRKFVVLMYYLPSLLFPLVGSPLGAVCIRDMTSSHCSASSNSRISIKQANGQYGPALNCN